MIEGSSNEGISLLPSSYLLLKKFIDSIYKRKRNTLISLPFLFLCMKYSHANNLGIYVMV